MIVDIAFDSNNQCGCVPECALTDALEGKLEEPTLDQIQPRTGCWNKVYMEPWLEFEPVLYAGMLVGGIIVHGQMKVEPGSGSSLYSLWVRLN